MTTPPTRDQCCFHSSAENDISSLDAIDNDSQASTDYTAFDDGNACVSCTPRLSTPTPTAVNFAISSKSTFNPTRRRTSIKSSLLQPSILAIESFCSNLIHNIWFQQLSFALIVTNAVILGISTMDFVTEHSNVEEIFEVIDISFLAMFTVELLIYFAALGGRGFLSDGWLMFDLVIITSSWFGLLVLSSAKLISLPMLRALRILRLLRLVGKVHVMKCVATAFLSLLPRMGAIVGLLSIFMYIFAVMFTSMFKSLYKDGYTSQDYFSTVDLSLFTLMQIMTTDGWADMAREVMVVYPWSWLFFVSFVTVSVFILVNLIAIVVFDHENEQHSILTALSQEWEKMTSETYPLQSKSTEMPKKGDSTGKEVIGRTLPPQHTQQACLTESQHHCCDSAKKVSEMQSQINDLSQQLSVMLCLLEEHQRSFDVLNTKLDTLTQTNSVATDVSTRTEMILTSSSSSTAEPPIIRHSNLT